MKQNIWQNDNGASMQSETHPGDGWYPLVNPARVHGATYTPYTRGSEVWKREANRVLASIARDNFNR